ncbi:hypothetical protein BU26DRAFT_562674 [Trematosphaeria pertusa]|uniref:DUF1640-domain-containing protein n=1 Tax=Trematosphaeria pertusa TaxID=390896 RepID=A0A6A6IKH9_9PLEO|nr:uncharacterized protein BU26DRAFT_562674 [Trematosphaeria pertusa]KAF2250709.1 hypothetical protein BU26DRAFT_562674 [Trematosphaeria pertusa]
MSSPRLPFLWPMLFRPLKPPRKQVRVSHRRAPSSRCFATTPLRSEESRPQRYGTAQEPAAHLQDSKAQGESSEQEKRTPGSIQEGDEDAPSQFTTPTSQSKTADTAEPVPPPDPPKTPDPKPLDTVLHMPSPQEEESRKPPHLKTPPYVHHFDTYSLVKDLTKSGFTQDQSITVMKAVRSILTDNMEVAREGLVSKSNVENETYLFRAACSELRTEVGNARKGEMERMRTERNQLQHEVDILGQRMSQETGHLKDELKGLFDDRKMAVRQEQRTMESKIQELNYKITIALNSDARSEIEGLRWILTRRAAITVGVTAFMLFVALRYSSYVSHQQKEQEKAYKKKPPPDEEQNPPSTGKPALGKDEPIGGELLTTEGGVSLA